MIYLVSCVGKKLGYPAPAQDLYISDWFMKARKFAYPHPWFILSAKFGLVPPTKVIPPYEVTLIRMGRNAREAWAEKVFKSIRETINLSETLVILAGDRYREFLAPRLLSYGYQIEIPMHQLSIGRQLQWMKEHTAKPNLF